MDELTRERYGFRRVPTWEQTARPKPLPRKPDELTEEQEARRRVLLGQDEPDGVTAEELRAARLRMFAMRRDRKLVAAIRRVA